MSDTHTLPIANIKIGKRHRREMGDLAGLSESIATNGLLHPVVVTPEGLLIAGERRLKACAALGWTKVPTTVIDLAQVARGEADENICRKDFTWAEAVDIKRALEPIEKAAAKERQSAAGERGREGGRGKRKPSGQFAQRVSTRAGDKAAKATGKKRRTLEKAEAVVSAAEQNPETFSDLAERLNDEDVRVDVVHREMLQRRERAAYRERADAGGTVADLVGLAQAGRKFAVIYPDPPWRFETYSGKGKQRSAERYYDTMSLDDIKALPVGDLAADDCALFLWIVWPELPGALDVVESWGFEFKSVGFSWVKTAPNAERIELNGEGLHWGMGYSSRANTEVCLLATKGKPMRMAADVHQVVIAPASDHSEKPEEVRRRIERLYNGPFLELFARKPVPGWTTWGNELRTTGESGSGK